MSMVTIGWGMFWAGIGGLVGCAGLLAYALCNAARIGDEGLGYLDDDEDQA